MNPNKVAENLLKVTTAIDASNIYFKDARDRMMSRVFAEVNVGTMFAQLQVHDFLETIWKINLEFVKEEIENPYKNETITALQAYDWIAQSPEHMFQCNTELVSAFQNFDGTVDPPDMRDIIIRTMKRIRAQIGQIVHEEVKRISDGYSH